MIGITEKNMFVLPSEKPFRLYASDLPDLVYCERLFYMKKVMDIPRVETYPMVRGTNEHEISLRLIKIRQ